MKRIHLRLFRRDMKQSAKCRQRTAFSFFGSIHNNELGMTLIEILVAMAILAATAVVFLVGMAASSKAVMVSQERVAVDSLAKSQMEYVKNLPYDDVDNPPVYAVDPGLAIPTGYNVLVNAVRLDPKQDGLANDDGIQQVTVTVNHNGAVAFTIVGQKLKP